jgi:PIN domain nuclease of toxin-antitoxin system
VRLLIDTHILLWADQRPRIIAQAYLEGMVLGTQDRLMRPYGVATLGLE